MIAWLSACTTIGGRCFISVCQSARNDNPTILRAKLNATISDSGVTCGAHPCRFTQSNNGKQVQVPRSTWGHPTVLRCASERPHRSGSANKRGTIGANESPTKLYMPRFFVNAMHHLRRYSRRSLRTPMSPHTWRGG